MQNSIIILDYVVAMENIQFKFSDHIASFKNYFEFYLKNKSRDCILFSEDGSKFKVHKELFGQTEFLRKILSSTKDHCCGTIEVICPCSKKELSSLVNFLYDVKSIVKKNMSLWKSLRIYKISLAFKETL